jgi:HK97 family phage prohead protease
MGEVEPLRMKRLAAPLEIKAVSEEGRIEGYASVFGVVDTDGDIVMPGAFRDSIMGKERVPMLWQHDSAEPIGVWDQMAEDEYGLKVAGRLLVNDVMKAREARALAMEGALGGLSIGFMVQGYKPRQDDKRGLEITKADLWETSLVTFPANPAAKISAVKAAIEQGRIPTKREVEAMLTRDAGLSRSQARALMASGYDGLAGTTQDAGSEDEDIFAKALEGLVLDIKGASSK